MRAEDQKDPFCHRGYVLEKDQVKRKNISGYSAFVILAEDTRDELQTMADYGGHVFRWQWIIRHMDVIRASIINNRLDVEEFCRAHIVIKLSL